MQEQINHSEDPSKTQNLGPKNLTDRETADQKKKKSIGTGRTRQLLTQDLGRVTSEEKTEFEEFEEFEIERPESDENSPTTKMVRDVADYGIKLQIIHDNEATFGYISSIDKDTGDVNIVIKDNKDKEIELKYHPDAIIKMQYERIKNMKDYEYNVITIHDKEPVYGQVTGFNETSNTVDIKYVTDQDQKPQKTTVDLVNFLKMQDDNNLAYLISKEIHKYQPEHTPDKIQELKQTAAVEQKRIENSPIPSEEGINTLKEIIQQYMSLPNNIREDASVYKDEAVVFNEDGSNGYITNIRQDNKAVLMDIPTTRTYINPETKEEIEEPFLETKWVPANDILKYNWPDLAVEEDEDINELLSN